MKIKPRSMRRHGIHALFIAGVALLLAICPCAWSGETPSPSPGTNVARQTLASTSRPVVVRDFAFDVADLHTDSGAMGTHEGPIRRAKSNLRPQETSAQKATRLAGLLSDTIAAELAALKIPATREKKDSPWPSRGLAVAGQFVQFDEGNRLKRAVIGFGAGASEVLAQVEVFDLEQSREQPVLVYGAGTGSKSKPGGIVMMNPYAMAAKYVLSRNASEKDVRTLGKRIATDLAQLQVGPQP